MKIAYVVCGFSNATEELVFEKDIDAPKAVLRKLFGLKKNDPMVDVCPITTDAQKAFFAQQFGIEFEPGNEYALHAYQPASRESIAELEAGKGKRFASVDDLMTDLKTDD